MTEKCITTDKKRQNCGIKPPKYFGFLNQSKKVTPQNIFFISHQHSYSYPPSSPPFIQHNKMLLLFLSLTLPHTHARAHTRTHTHTHTHDTSLCYYTLVRDIHGKDTHTHTHTHTHTYRHIL